jgi:hypothetical protein
MIRGAHKMKIRLLTGPLLLALLASCQEHFLVKVEGGNPTRFAFYEDNMFSDQRIAPCLRYLQVYEIQEASTPVKLWDIRPSGRECVDVDAVGYGVAPKGFARQGPLSPLRIGSTYRVEVEDDGSRNGSGQFRL